MKRILIGIILGAMLLAFAGCGTQDEKASPSSAQSFATIEDDMGRSVVLEKSRNGSS